MKSVFVMCGVVGALSDAANCQNDEATMLQGLNMVRKQTESKTTPAKDAKSILKNMRDVANSLVEGSVTTMSQDEIIDLLNTSGETIAQLSPALRQQVENAQQQIDDAITAFQGCQTTELSDDLGWHVAEIESCSNTLEQLGNARGRQCRIALDCLCDEAKARQTDQRELCFTKRENYEHAFCNNHATCSMIHQCHSSETDVYNRLRNDVEAEMGLITEEYMAVEQAKCLNDLSSEILTPPRSRLDASAVHACLDVDVSSIQINYPVIPAAPAACTGNAENRCVAGYASLPGNDVTNYRQFNLGSMRGTAVQCAQRCNRNPECLGFERQPENGMCYLRSTAETRYMDHATRGFFKKMQ